MRINLYPNLNLTNKQQPKVMKKTNQIAFGSYLYEEAIMKKLEDLDRIAAEEDFNLQRKNLSVDNIDKMVTEYDKGTETLLTTVAEMTYNSEHKEPIVELFGSAAEAKNERMNLTPSCQKTSLELRNKMQSTQLVKNPIHSLIAAGQIKKLMPDETKIPQNMASTIVEKSKQAVLLMIKNSDLSKFDNEEKTLISSLTDIIKQSKGAEFCDNYYTMLKQLISKYNSSKQSPKITQQITPKVVPQKQVRYIPPQKILRRI